MGNLVFQATLGGQVNLVGPNTASTFNLNVPATSSTIATLTGTETFTNKTLTSPTLASANITTGLTLTGAAGTSGQVLTSGGSGVAPTWASVTAGDVSGPASATANGLALFNSTTGKLIKDSAASDGLIYGLTIGRGAGAQSGNTVLGASALVSNSTGVSCTAIGFNAAYTNTASSVTAIGSNALRLNTAAGCTAVGAGAGAYNTTGRICAIGQNALNANTTGTGNTAVGSTGTGYTPTQSVNTTGSYNTSIGEGSLANNTVDNNTAVGAIALYSNTTGYNNTACGQGAGYANTTGIRSTFIGQNAGNNLATGDAGIYIGWGCAASSTSVSNETVIGANLTGKGAATTFIGTSSAAAYQGNNSATWSITSDQRLEKNIVDNTEGLDKISQIRVRNFEYRLPEEVTELESSNAIAITGVQLGVIAQELQQVCSDCVKTESTGVMSVNQENITWHMVNAIKDLKALNDTLTARITALEAK